MEITTWAQEYFQKTLSVNTIHRAIRRCRLNSIGQKEAISKHDPEAQAFSLGQGSFKWTVAKWKTVLLSDESKFEVLFGKLGRHVIRTKEDKDNPSCYQCSVQKPASLMVWGLHECVWHGQLTHLERHHQCWKVYPSSRTNICSHTDVVSFRKTLHFPTWQCQTTLLHQLQHHGCVEGSGYWNGQPAVQIFFTHRKHLAHHKEEDATKKT